VKASNLAQSVLYTSLSDCRQGEKVILDRQTTIPSLPAQTPYQMLAENFMELIDYLILTIFKGAVSAA
jgi:hypothetical protein